MPAPPIEGLTPHERRVATRIIKRPRTAKEIATLLGFDDARAVSRALGVLRESGLIVQETKHHVKVYRTPSNDS